MCCSRNPPASARRASFRVTESAADAAAPPVFPAGRKLLFVECTHTYHSELQSGIQRVVRNILRNAGPAAEARGYALVPVILRAGRFHAADLRQVLDDKLKDGMTAARAEPRPRTSPRERVLGIARPLYHAVRGVLAALLPFAPVQRFLFAHPARFGLSWCVLSPWRVLRWVIRRGKPLPPREPDRGTLDAIGDHSGNILLMLDSSWHLEPWTAVERFAGAGGTVIAMIYDLFPVTYRDTVMPELAVAFDTWLHGHLRWSRDFVTISRTMADELEAYLAGVSAAGGPPRQVTSFYLGSELDFVDPDQRPSDQVLAVFGVPEHVFIVVGSIEPRKNHGYILDAFDQYWARGGTARLVVIGRHGWRNEAVMARMAQHEEAGARLFLMRDMTDSELDYAYRYASALVIASQAEGFGLPVVEAFQRGLPVLCSDIAVFREIAEGRAVFFSLDDPASLADAVTVFCAAHDVAARGMRDEQPWLTWRESTEQLMDIVLGPPVTPI